MAKGRYKIGTISRLTGVSPITLRTWERRYQLLDPERGSGRQRLYTDEDLEVLQRVSELLKTGRSIGELAALGRSALLKEPAQAEAKSATLSFDPKIPQTRIEEWQDILVKGAVEVNSTPIRHALNEMFAVLHPWIIIDQVLAPSAIKVGQRWAAGTLSVAGEHLFSNLLNNRLRFLLHSSQPAPNGHSADVICAGFPEEDHELGLLVLSYGLACKGQTVMYLGSCVPFSDLNRTVKLNSAKELYLSVTINETFEKHKDDFKAFLEANAKTIQVNIGGNGLPLNTDEYAKLGANIVRCHSLQSFIEWYDKKALKTSKA